MKINNRSSETERLLRVARNRIDVLENELLALKIHADDLQKQIDAFRGSRLWRMAAPVRIVQDIIARSRSLVDSSQILWDLNSRLRMIRGRIWSKRRTSQIERSADQCSAEAELKAFLESDRKLVFSRSAKPEVSIIVVLYNQAPLTFRCLCSIAREVLTPYELIVIDNGSTDATTAVLDRLEGAAVVRNPTNLFFLRAVRQGAERANSEHILLLNNDAILQEGAVEYALDTMKSAADIGAVGGRILLSEKTLQEAGNIIWRDGSCLSYGRDEDSEGPEFMFQRDVDYCSGAFLLLRHDLFRKLDYFDERFLPAYYEETDLCMRLREAGYRIVYDPRVQVLHREFGSLSAEKAIALQQKNRDIFFRKHKRQLETKHLSPHPDHVLLARARLPRSSMKILFLDDQVPHPSLGGGFPRAQQIVRALQELGHFVSFYPLQFPKDDWKDVYSVLPPQVEVMLGYGIMRLDEFMIERMNYYDKIIVSRPHNMAILRRVLKSKSALRQEAELIYDAEALFALRTIRQLQVLGKNPTEKQIRVLLAKEIDLARFADQVVVVSENEARYFSDGGCQRLTVLTHSLEPWPTISLFHERTGFLFVGALNDDLSPNTDSLVWFVDEIMPRLRRNLGRETVLNVIGRNEASRTKGLTSPGVRLLGRVPRLNGHYDQARVFIAPTRFAAGIPHKVHEAAAHGVPVVATSIVADQLGWRDRRDLLVADDPQKFSEACEELYTDEKLWYSVRKNALERIQSECSPERFRSKLAELVR